MKKGVLLVNLGSPDSTNPKDVKKYLGEFLMDEFVIDLPWLFRAFLVKGIILNTRPKESAKAYKSIWWDEGSPLIVLSKRLQNKIQSKVDIPVELAMRYRNPSIKSGLENLHKQGVEEVLVIPLYPQYAMSTTETIIDSILDIKEEFFPKMNLKYLKPFYNNEEYIEVLTNSIKKELPEKFDRLIFSYHGVPVRHILKGDNKKRKRAKLEYFGYQTTDEETNYQKHCYKTTALVQQKLGLSDKEIMVAFQSRLGMDPWLEPYFDRTLNNLPKKGIENVVVVSPAFVSDCLETLEELAEEGKELFHEAGGKNYKVIPCLNDSDPWVDLLVKWIKEFK